MTLQRIPRIDLHAHTCFSDGILTPESLCALALERGVGTLAICDHFTTQGSQQAVSWARRLGIDLIPGVEINTQGPLACHVLGYGIAASNTPFQEWLDRCRAKRQARLQAMVGKLQAKGFAITWDEVVRASPAASWGRPHLADALLRAGAVHSRLEAFQRYLGAGRSAYVPCEVPTAPEAIEKIRAAGGVAVLAHPASRISDTHLQHLVNAGLQGIEAYHPDHTPALTQRYLDHAKRFGLIVTGGSDFHGDGTGHAPLASVLVPDSVLGPLRRALGRV